MNKLHVTMRDYILETPQVVLNNVDHSDELTASLVEAFLQKDYKQMIIVACGSSHNASHMARYYMMEHLNIDVKIITPFTFTHYEHIVSPDDFVVCVSQSGCSTNTIDALRMCRQLQIPAIGITGNPESDFKTEADLVVNYGVGEELIGYVTKGVVTLATYFMLFSLEVARKKEMISSQQYAAEKEEFRQAMVAHKEMVDAFDHIYQVHRKDFTSMNNLYVIGNGTNRGTAMEGALKVGETVHVPCLDYEVDEYIHGPNLQLAPSYTVVYIDAGDEAGKRCVQAYRATRTVTDHTFIITNDPSVDDDHAIRIPHRAKESISSLHNVVFFQLLAHTVSDELKTMRRHPLFSENFKQIISTKSESYVDHHDELITEE